MPFPCTDIAISDNDDPNPLVNTGSLYYKYNGKDMGSVKWVNDEDCDEEVWFYAIIKIIDPFN